MCGESAGVWQGSGGDERVWEGVETIMGSEIWLIETALLSLEVMVRHSHKERCSEDAALVAPGHCRDSQSHSMFV